MFSVEHVIGLAGLPCPVTLILLILAEYEKDREATVERLTEFLKTWLINHIQGTDQKYSPYLKSKGVS